jgi:hypothetical protein
VRRVATLLLSASLLAAGGCKPRGATEGTKSPDGASQRAIARAVRSDGPRLPAPHAIPAEPPLLVVLAAPHEFLDTLRAYTGDDHSDAAWLDEALDGLGRPALEQRLGTAFDSTRTIAFAEIQGEVVALLPIRAAEVASLKAEMERWSVVERVARRLPAASGETQPVARAPTLAYLDERAGVLALGSTTRGLATALQLPAHFRGEPLRAIATRENVAAWGVQLPASQLRVRGRSAEDLEVRAMGLDTKAIAGLDQLQQGALVALLGAPDMAWGVTTRWAHWQGAVADIIAQASSQVADANFLVRGILEDLLKRFNATLRAWNGRVALGGGPKNHLLAAFGSDAPDKAERAVLRLLEGILANLKLAATFGVKVPKIALRKQVATVGDTAIHQLVLRDLPNLPPEARALHSDGALQIALAFPPSAGAALLAAGPTAPKALENWVRHAQSSRESGVVPVFAASSAVDPAALRAALEDRGDSASPPAGLALEASRPPVYVTLRRESNEWVLRVGPKP